MARTIWRLTKAKHAATALSGYGSVLRAGRWHRRGVPVVYAAASPALALLETLVHVEDAEALLAFDYAAVPIRLTEDFGEGGIERLPEEDLPADWRAWPWPASMQALGTRWMREKRSALLSVPSAVVPHERNYLVNPQHPRFGELEVGPPEPFPVDPRLARR